MSSPPSDKKILFLFVDALGIGPADASVNPQIERNC